MQVISRFNSVFDCPEYLHKNGRGFTLHLDLAMHFDGHDEAVTFARAGDHFPRCTVRDGLSDPMLWQQYGSGL